MTTKDTDIKVKPNLDIETEEFVNIVHNSQTDEAVIIPYTDEEKADALSRRAAFAALQAQLKIDEEAKEAEQAALKEKAALNPATDEKLLQAFSPGLQREIVANILARLVYLEKLLGVNHSAKG